MFTVIGQTAKGNKFTGYSIPQRDLDHAPDAKSSGAGHARLKDTHAHEEILSFLFKPMDFMARYLS
jgi:hypothetical protein